MNEKLNIGKLPILALRGLAVFPDQTVHFEVGRKKSVLALENAMDHDQTLLLIPQRDISVDDPTDKDLYPIGTVAKVKQVLKTSGETIRVLVTGLYRARIQELTQEEPFLYGNVISVSELSLPDDLRSRALRREANALYATYLEVSEFPAQAVQLRMLGSDHCGFVADSIAQHSGMDFRDKVALLGQMNPVKRLETAVRLLRQEVEMQRLEADIQEKTRANMDRQHREYYLREQMKVIQEELGDDDESEYAAYEVAVRKLQLDEASEEKLLKDIARLRKQQFGSAEASVLRNYLDTVLELPWNKTTKERIDVSAASKVLERDHFGMEKVKERILETIAVRQMAPEMPPQIICLVGPPGVGKTSIA